MHDILLTPIRLSELEILIENCVRKAIAQNPLNSKEEEYLTRRETAKILGVTLPTINAWVHSGKITAYRIGSNIRFKKSDLENSLIKIKA